MCQQQRPAAAGGEQWRRKGLQIMTAPCEAEGVREQQAGCRMGRMRRLLKKEELERARQGWDGSRQAV